MPDEKPTNNPDVDALAARIEALERDNQRLRERLPPELISPNPWFNPRLFQRALIRVLVSVYVPLFFIQLVPVLAQTPLLRPLRGMQIAGIRVFDFAGIGTRHPGFGVGLVSFGGIGVGAIGIGGVGIGLISFGGASLGIIAVGGGSCGLIAFGGGAVGYIAIGGGAAGYYALGSKGFGKHVFAINRQDMEAIRFFTRLFPSLRRSVTTAMPVIPMGETEG